jgi:alpha-beta hydrolase superfamily lysophospholipase
MDIPILNTEVYEVTIPIGEIYLEGELFIPENAIGLVIFSHGSGSSRFSPRNNMVANVLHEKGIGTLLFDLLTTGEDSIYANRFDINLLSQRLIETTKWIKKQVDVENLDIAYFGASTGAASALNAAAEMKKSIKAVVSRGGRPDLSMDYLPKVKAAVLLIVGGNDDQVIDMNKIAYDQLECEKELKIIPGASHLFEEDGKLEEVARMSAEWFEKHFK